MLALIRGNDQGWTSAQILLLLGAALVLIVVFVAVELRRSQPMLDLHLFRKPAFTGAQIVAFTLHASMFSMFLYIVLYMQNVLGYSPLETGVRFLPISVLSFLAAPVAGKLVERFPVRAFLGAGLFLVGIGLLLMAGIAPSDDWTTLLAGFLVAGVGIGFINPPLATAAIGVVEPRRAGAASGINSTFRQVGTAVGHRRSGRPAPVQGERQSRCGPGGYAAPPRSGRSHRRGGFLGRSLRGRAGGPSAGA